MEEKYIDSYKEYRRKEKINLKRLQKTATILLLCIILLPVIITISFIYLNIWIALTGSIILVLVAFFYVKNNIRIFSENSFSGKELIIFNLIDTILYLEKAEYPLDKKEVRTIKRKLNGLFYVVTEIVKANNTLFTFSKNPLRFLNRFKNYLKIDLIQKIEENIDRGEIYGILTWGHSLIDALDKNDLILAEKLVNTKEKSTPSILKRMLSTQSISILAALIIYAIVFVFLYKWVDPISAPFNFNTFLGIVVYLIVIINFQSLKNWIRKFLDFILSVINPSLPLTNP